MSFNQKKTSVTFAVVLNLILAFLENSNPAHATLSLQDPPILTQDHSIPDETWSLHFQLTTVTQLHPSFRSPYEGKNSLHGYYENRTSLTSTLFLGRTLWKNAEIYFNPELAAGSGVSETRGIAGYSNGEIYRVDSANPKPNLSRLYLKQVFGLGVEREKIEADKNQLATQVAAKRLTLIARKFSLNDFFDRNSYSHDPRTQFVTAPTT